MFTKLLLFLKFIIIISKIKHFIYFISTQEVPFKKFNILANNYYSSNNFS